MGGVWDQIGTGWPPTYAFSKGLFSAMGTPALGALYLATDVGLLFVGDGAAWQVAAGEGHAVADLAAAAPISLTNDATETTLLSWTAPANFLRVGTRFDFEVVGWVTSPATTMTQITHRAKVSGATRTQQGVIPSASMTTQWFLFRGGFTVRAIAAGSATCHAWSELHCKYNTTNSNQLLGDGNPGVTFAMSSTNPQTIDLTMLMATVPVTGTEAWSAQEATIVLTKL